MFNARVAEPPQNPSDGLPNWSARSEKFRPRSGRVRLIAEYLRGVWRAGCKGHQVARPPEISEKRAPPSHAWQIRFFRRRAARTPSIRGIGGACRTRKGRARRPIVVVLDHSAPTPPMELASSIDFGIGVNRLQHQARGEAMLHPDLQGVVNGVGHDSIVVNPPAFANLRSSSVSSGLPGGARFGARNSPGRCLWCRCR